MKRLINKSLAILTLIAMAATMSYADKNEAPILVAYRNYSVNIYPVDYITIHSIIVGKQNGSCKVDIKDIKFGYHYDRKLGEQLSWTDNGSIDLHKSYGALCRPSSDENKNDKYIIVLTTNFGSYVYEYIYAEHQKAENEYILPLIDYKK